MPQEDCFIWKVEETGRVFPVDYAISEAAKKWGIEPRTVKKYISSNPFFQEFYSQIQFNFKEKISEEKNRIQAIPLELEPFFRCYIEEALKSKEKKGIANGEISAEFDRTLCLRLFQESQAAEMNKDRQDELYCYRNLYNNAAFQEAVSSQQWEEQFQWRCDTIRSLVKHQNAENQIQDLKRIIAYLDIQIAYLLSVTSQEAPASPGKPPCSSFLLDTFPLELFVHARGESQNPPGKDASYCVKNFNFDTMQPESEQGTITEIKTLYEAFEIMRKNKLHPNEVRNATREQFQLHLRKPPDKTSFQKSCEKLTEYLNAYTSAASSSTVEREINERCKKYYAHIILGTPCPGGAVLADINAEFQGSVRARFIEEMASCFSNSFIGSHQWVLRYMGAEDCMPVFCHCIHEVLKASAYGEESNDCRLSISELFQNSIKQLWGNELLGFSCRILDNLIPENLIVELNSRIANTCFQALTVLGIYDKMKANAIVFQSAWCSPDYLNNAWAWYNSLQYSDNVSVQKGFGFFDILLIRAIFTCRVWDEYQTTCSTILRCYNTMHSNIM